MSNTGIAKMVVADLNYGRAAARITMLKSITRIRYKPVTIEIYGQLAALLRISERAAEPLESRGALVAGIGFEPMTFR
ncbi:hypothetical protein NLM27_26575 [Bradyrhizobium sp. CCGB12]|uniref:hypothetical protein n=1 Tax=Bradyrhizobium sp. CCGB12 TaxID=2949632 RepID=UPI0020B426AD|nr:hypothetical protein [Bradyrhizobium sp. CCGB12]MCP3392319.1 hypothetical protein [Bradyrhizobium sp. CCGB12]